MQLALTALAGLGALLFVISFLGYIISAFRHHFVTGLISMLPVLNIITLPSLWDKNSGKFIIGFIGLSITIGAWFIGADQNILNLIARGNNSTEEVVINSIVPSVNSNLQSTDTAVSKPIHKKQESSFSLNENNMLRLPDKALYKMEFDIVPLSQISSLKGRIVQITKNDNQLIEGRIKRVSPGSVVLDGLFENELTLASIKQLKLMVKKPNQ